jgi:hypothetical protein
MQRPVPFPSLPIRRKRRSKLPVTATVMFALFTAFIVFSLIRGREKPVTDDLIILPPAPASNSKPAVPAAKPPSSAMVTASTVFTGKQASAPNSAKPQAIKSLKAMPAAEVREEFEMAASVLRRYFQSPTEGELQKLLRHPELTLPRYRAWNLKRRVVPAIPLKVGPQFGVSGSLFITSVKLADGSSRLAALEHTDQGYRLDWESFCAWGERTFNDLGSLSDGETAILRVTVKPSSAAPPVSAPASAFTLSHPDERATLAAYAMEDVLERSKAGRALRRTSGGMFTVRLAVGEKDKKSGWARIAEVVSVGWVEELSAR